MKNKLTVALDIVKNATQNTYLLNNFWKEKTTLLLNGVREADKTMAAIGIAAIIGKRGYKSIYVDTQSRLDMYADVLVNTPDMLVLRPAFDGSDDKHDYADMVISAIEEAILETDVKVFIVDSVTRIAALSFGRNASASYVMKRLVALQIRYGISLVVISHDSTKATDRSLVALADFNIKVNDDDADEGSPSATPEAPKSNESSDCSNVESVVPLEPETSRSVKVRSQLSRRDRRLMRRAKQKSTR